MRLAKTLQVYDHFEGNFKYKMRKTEKIEHWELQPHQNLSTLVISIISFEKKYMRPKANSWDTQNDIKIYS